jgi:hypothetical protein
MPTAREKSADGCEAGGSAVADGLVLKPPRRFLQNQLSVWRCSGTHGGAAKTADDRSPHSVARRRSYGSSTGGAHSASCNCSLARSFTAGWEQKRESRYRGQTGKS